MRRKGKLKEKEKKENLLEKENVRWADRQTEFEERARIMDSFRF